MDSIVLRVAKSQTRLSDFHFHIRVAKEKEYLYAKRTDIKEQMILHQKKCKQENRGNTTLRGGNTTPTPCLSSFG